MNSMLSRKTRSSEKRGVLNRQSGSLGKKVCAPLETPKTPIEHFPLISQVIKKIPSLHLYLKGKNPMNQSISSLIFFTNFP